MKKIICLLSILLILSKVQGQIQPNTIISGDNQILTGPFVLVPFAVTNTDSHPNIYALYDSGGGNLSSLRTNTVPVQIFRAGTTNITHHSVRRSFAPPLLGPCVLDPGDVAVVTAARVKNGIRVFSSGNATFGPLTTQ